MMFEENAEVKFDVGIKGCFSENQTELHLIPTEAQSGNSFFQVSRTNENAFVVEVKRDKAEKLVELLLDFATKEEVMPKGRSTTIITVKITWKNISYPKLQKEGEINLSEMGGLSPKDLVEFFPSINLSIEKKQEIQSLINKGLFSPTLAIFEFLEELSKSKTDFLEKIEKL